MYLTDVLAIIPCFHRPEMNMRVNESIETGVGKVFLLYYGAY